ncbi:MAG: regulatory protein GemA [Methylophaga sp.]|nr:regulatory protein GemA [Methylophaga sp.]
MKTKTPINKCYTLLAVGKNYLQMDDDFYRDEFLVQHGATKKNGRVSASTMDIHQLHAALHSMKLLGFTPKKKATTRISDWRTPRINKITAIWFAMHKAGIVNNPSKTAMQKWCSTVTKKAQLEWVTATDLNNCIEALKSWAAREHVKLAD